MAEYLIQDSTLEDIADAIRAKTGGTNTMTPAQMAAAIRTISGKETLSWHQCPVAVQNYLENVTYDASDYATSQIANYAPSVVVETNTKPIGITSGGVTYYNEVPNKQTPFANAQTAGTLQPLDRLRWIRCNTAQNVRDLGGWTCNGGTVKYGMLIRGGQCAANDAQVLVNQCGVGFELSLAGGGEETGASVLGSNVQYQKFSEYAWYELASKTTLWQKMIRVVFDCAKWGRCLYFHCSAGADRTGTLACIIEALLGMSQSDIDKDYELTCFSTGTGSDTDARRRNETEWQGLINEINSYSGSSFRDKAAAFVASLGFTYAEINAFRRAVIDGTPEDIVEPSSDTYTNQISISTDANGDIFNGTGYQVSARVKSSGEVVAQTAGSIPIFATGFIPVNRGDILRFYNCWQDPDGTAAQYGTDYGGLNNGLYSTSHVKSMVNYWGQSGIFDNLVTDSSGNIIQMEYAQSSTMLIRLTLAGVAENAIVTINEEMS